MNTFKFLNSFQLNADTFTVDMTSIRQKLFSLGVCWTDSVNGDFMIDTPFRVILYTRNNGVDFKNPMVKECNGIVFEYNDGWNLLAMPQFAFCTNKISMRRVNDMHRAGCYDIFEVLDATIITLYYYNGEWKISSTKGYDIGNMHMVDGMTYMDVLKHLMNTRYKMFNLDNLQKTHSYTIAMRYSKYHIFNETKHLASRTKNVPKHGTDMNSYIMLTTSANLNTMTFSKEHVAGIPRQNPLNNVQDVQIKTLENYSRDAFAKYSKAYQLQKFKYKPLYGYILRACNHNVPNEYSTIFIESELFKVIKNGLYNNNDMLRDCQYDKLVIRMISNNNRYHQFKIMFDQFIPKFEKLEKRIELVGACVVQKIFEQDFSDPNPMINDLIDQFKNTPDITIGIVKDSLYSKKNMHYLLNILK